MILDAEKDWREVEGASLERTWFTFDQRDKFHDVLAQFTSVAEPDDKSRGLRVFGRTIHIPWSSAMLCKISFAELCDQSLGPADYLTIASHFAVIAITDIPVLPLSQKDQARRFISLINALYESRCRIICLAEGLFFPDALSSNEIHVDTIMAESVSETHELYRPNVSSYDTPRMREAPAAPKIPLSLDTLSIFSGEEEQFAFKRALSRLKEMTSSTYNRTDRWSPLPLDARKWETDSSLKYDVHKKYESHPSHTGHKPDKSLDVVTNDFSDEASYTSGGATFKRPHAPYLSPDHVWGVREQQGERMGQRRQKFQTQQ